jgi:imidazolonepropionase-like amidohydrolase
MIRRSLIVLVLPSLMWLAAWTQAGTDTIVLQGGTIIDGTGAPPISDAVVVIQGNRIQAAGPRGSVRAPANARVISTAGKFIIPGLIDSHVHYQDWAGELFLVHGVTTVVDLGNPADYMVALSDSIERGFDVGPRIFSTGEFLRSRRRSVSYTHSAETAFLADAAQAREKVRELVGRGMKLVKAMELTHEQLLAVVDEAHKLGVPVAAHTVDARRSIAAGIDYLAHHWGIPSGAITVSANLERYKASRHRAGVDEVLLPPAPPRRTGTEVHCSDALMDEQGMNELVAQMVKRNVYYSPAIIFAYKPFSRRAEEQERANNELFARNELQYVPMDVRDAAISTFHRLRSPVRAGNSDGAGFTWMDDLTSEELAEYRACYAKSLDFTRRFVAAGGKLSTGTDTGGGSSIPGIGLHHEMEIMAEAGITAMQVLQSATLNTAQFLKMDKSLGTVEAGKLADLVVLSADPLADISNTQTIDTVIKNGTIVERRFHKEYDPIIKSPMDSVVQHLPTIWRGSPYYRTPVVLKVTPGLATEGSPEIEVVVQGLGFSGASVVRLVNNRVRTTFVSSELLRAVLPARMLRGAGTWPVTVQNPQPGGGVSNAYGFIVKFK